MLSPLGFTGRLKEPSSEGLDTGDGMKYLTVFKDVGLDPELAELWEENHDIPRPLLAALILKESSARPLALRFEPKYRWHYRIDDYVQFNYNYNTEKALQSFSYGPIQIMGAVARELGYQGSLMELRKAEFGTFWGMCHLGRLYEKYGNWPDAISSYNQGSPRKKLLTGKYKNHSYVEGVINHAVTLGWQGASPLYGQSTS